MLHENCEIGLVVYIINGMRIKVRTDLSEVEIC